MRIQRIQSVGILLLVVLLHVGIAHACPGCKQALSTAEGEQANMVNGYFWSILFMLAMPFTLFGLFAGSMYLAVRKARREVTRNPAEVKESARDVHVHA